MVDCNLPRELNQSETIFLKREETASKMNGEEVWKIRSFTPYHEEPFCGHGILAAGITLTAQHLQPQGKRMLFRTSGALEIGAVEVPSSRLSTSELFQHGKACTLKLEMPAAPVTDWLHGDLDVTNNMAKCFGVDVSKVLGLGRNSLLDLFIEMDPSVDFSASGMTIDPVALMDVSPPRTRSQIITSKGDNYGVDFVKRVFAYGSEGRPQSFRARIERQR